MFLCIKEYFVTPFSDKVVAIFLQGHFCCNLLVRLPSLNDQSTACNLEKLQKYSNFPLHTVHSKFTDFLIDVRELSACVFSLNCSVEIQRLKYGHPMPCTELWKLRVYEEATKRRYPVWCFPCELSWLLNALSLSFVFFEASRAKSDSIKPQKLICFFLSVTFICVSKICRFYGSIVSDFSINLMMASRFIRS